MCKLMWLALIGAMLLPVAAAQRSKVSESALPDDAIQRSGFVVLPAGTPADERVVVVARSSARFEGRSGSEAREERVVAGADGAFEVAFAPGSKRGWLRIEGRYLFMEQRVKVDLAEEPAPVMLRPKLGARISGRVVARDGGELDPDFLGALRVRLSQDGRRSTLPGADRPLDGGAFEWNGLDTTVRYELSLVQGGAEDMRDAEQRGAGHRLELSPGDARELDIDLPRGVRVQGVVLGEDGELLVGARVRVGGGPDLDSGTQRAPHILMNVETDSHGEFVVAGLPAGEFRVTVEAPGFVDSSRRLGTQEDGARVSDLRIELEPAGVLAGRVQWPDGRPIAGTRVIAWREDRGMPPWAEGADANARTDADGQFELGGLSSGRYLITAYEHVDLDALLPGAPLGAIDSGGATLRELSPGTRDCVLVVQPEPGLSGRVTDESGRPVQSFRVRARPIRDPQDWDERVPVSGEFDDPLGSFELPNIADGPWMVEVEAPGYFPLFHPQVTMPDGGAALELRLVRAARIAGTVLAPDGAPASRAWIELQLDWDVELSAERIKPVRADREGRFECGELPPGRLWLTAHAKGHGQSEPLAVDLAPGALREGLELRLTETARLSVALDPEIGRRAARRVTLGPTWTPDTYYRSASRTERTDEAGVAEFDALSPGLYDLEVEEIVTMLPGGPRVRSARVELQAGETLQVTLGAPVGPPVLLHGTVRVGGTPCAGVELSAQCGVRPRMHGMAPVTTDEQGAYRMRVPESGPFDVAFALDGTWSGSARFELPAVVRFQRDFDLGSGRLFGVVRSAAGAPLPGVELELDAGPAFETRWGITDERGEFDFEWLPVGELVLRYGPSRRTRDEGLATFGNRAVRMSLDGEVRLALVLEESGSVQGVVRRPDGNAPPFCRLELQTEDGLEVQARGSVRVDPLGRFEIEGLAPGTLRMRAFRDELAGPWREVVVRSGAASDVTLEL